MEAHNGVNSTYLGSVPADSDLDRIDTHSSGKRDNPFVADCHAARTSFWESR